MSNNIINGSSNFHPPANQTEQTLTPPNANRVTRQAGSGYDWEGFRQSVLSNGAAQRIMGEAHDVIADESTPAFNNAVQRRGEGNSIVTDYEGVRIQHDAMAQGFGRLNEQLGRLRSGSQERNPENIRQMQQSLEQIRNDADRLESSINNLQERIPPVLQNMRQAQQQILAADQSVQQSSSELRQLQQSLQNYRHVPALVQPATSLTLDRADDLDGNLRETQADLNQARQNLNAGRQAMERGQEALGRTQQHLRTMQQDVEHIRQSYPQIDSELQGYLPQNQASSSNAGSGLGQVSDGTDGAPPPKRPRPDDTNENTAASSSDGNYYGYQDDKHRRDELDTNAQSPSESSPTRERIDTVSLYRSERRGDMI